MCWIWAEPLGIWSQDLSPQKNIHVLPHCNSQRTWPVPVKMQLLLRAVTHPKRDQDNNSLQVMKSYQNNSSTEENRPSRCIARVKATWQKHATHIILKQTSSKGRWVSGCSPILNLSWKKSATKTWATALITKLAVNSRAVHAHQQDHQPQHWWDTLECCAQLWPSQDEIHVDILEGVQQRATRTTRGLEHLS